MPAKTRHFGADQVVLDGDRLAVVSRVNMDGWDVRRHRHSVIRFDGRSWRITGKTTGKDKTIRYELAPWTPVEQERPGPEIEYGPEYVAARDRALAAGRRREGTSLVLRAVTPFTGFLWGRTKERLDAAYGIDPAVSTWHSVFLEYLIALGGIVATAVGVFTVSYPVGPFVLVAIVTAVDGVVRWDRIIGEENPPPGFYEWIVTRR